MFFQGLFPEGFSDLLSGGSFFDAEKFIILGGIDLLFGFLRLFLFLGHTPKAARESAESSEATRKHDEKL